MTNPIFNPQPNYSGVTIQISNPAVNVSPQRCAVPCDEYNSRAQNKMSAYAQNGYYSLPNYGAGYSDGYANITTPQISQVNPMYKNGVMLPQPLYNNANDNSGIIYSEEKPTVSRELGYAHAYPQEYYLNKYNNGTQQASESLSDTANSDVNGIIDNKADVNQFADMYNDKNIEEPESATDININSYKMYADKKVPKDTDMTRSKNIIEDLDDRVSEQEQEKKNSKETKIVALTDDYIKSLENYLDNPNDEIRLMASKEVLTRLDEDKERYNDAALNALLNKMMQDPSKLVRIAALSAFSSQLASGNDYTVELLHNIQSNPNADKEDILQAADILLKMSAGVEVKRIPNPSQKNEDETKKV